MVLPATLIPELMRRRRHGNQSDRALPCARALERSLLAHLKQKLFLGGPKK